MSAWTIDEWAGLYGESWKGEIVDDAFRHPAKFSRALIRKIYQHCADEGWLREGDRVIDPFGGVALGGLEALRLGLHWTGCELEPAFVELGNANIALWNKRYGGRFAKWGTARLLQGDSRKLATIIAGADGVVSSPPYAGNGKSDYLLSDDGKTRKRDEKRGYRQGEGSFRGSETYGDTPGQLGRMKDDGYSAVVSSPPWESVEGANAANKFSDPEGSARLRAEAYRTGAISGHGANEAAILKDMQRANSQVYGDTPGNVGNATGDNFWESARLIVEQTFAVLAHSGHAVWVVKGFVRHGQIVDFPGQWRALCESVGFVTLHEHHALLTEQRGTQLAHDGNHKDHSVKRASFFRRLAEFNSKAKKFWPSLDRPTQAYWLVASHIQKWKAYRTQLDKPKAPRKPTRSMIVHGARALAYRDAGEPAIEIETEIGWECVYCMVRP